MTDHGKWNQSGIPHKGWLCQDIQDLGDDRETCEMCEQQQIRFVHVMSIVIDAVELTLRCGCVCAGRMEEDLKAAKSRENKAKALARAKQKALEAGDDEPLVKWRVADTGSHWFRHEAGVRGTVYKCKAHDGYSFVLNDTADQPHFAKRKFAEVAEAKAAAEQMLSMWLKHS